MIGLEILINGERACVAGENGKGILGASIYAQMFENAGQISRGYLYVDGIAGDGKTMTRKTWLEREGLALGDEILIRLKEVDHCDEPVVGPPPKMPFWDRLRMLFA